MNAARLLIEDITQASAPTRHWTTYATVYISAIPDAASQASNDSEPAELIRDKITQTAIAVEDMPHADGSDEPRRLLSFTEVATGAAGAVAAFVAFASVIAA